MNISLNYQNYYEASAKKLTDIIRTQFQTKTLMFNTAGYPTNNLYLPYLSQRCLCFPTNSKIYENSFEFYKLSSSFFFQKPRILFKSSRICFSIKRTEISRAITQFKRSQILPAFLKHNDVIFQLNAHWHQERVLQL